MPENETHDDGPMKSAPLVKGPWAKLPSCPTTSKRQSKGPWTNVPSEQPYGRRTRFIGENEIQCEGPGCDNYVRSGWVEPRQKRFFCCESCDWRFYNRRHVVGICEHCGEPIMGTPAKGAIRRYCSHEHYVAANAERTLGQTGVFRELIENYLTGSAKNNYSEGTLPAVKMTLAQFFGFVVNVEKITDIEKIRPSVITRFIVFQRARGITSGNYIGVLSTFFKRLQAEELIDMANPVVPYVHNQGGRACEARPFTDEQLNRLSALFEASGDTVLNLAFWLGVECGLRVGEVCNIRLEDIDREKQAVFIRLPTKNNQTRTVPFHNQVLHYYDIWLKERNPKCKHDHLLHTVQLAFFDTSGLDMKFRWFLRGKGVPDSDFQFHQGRHSWATRLMNNGMELAVLKELGGWVSWNSMQRYIKVLDKTVRHQYEAAYKQLQQQEQLGAETVMSLLDFANMDKVQPTTTSSSAT